MIDYKIFNVTDLATNCVYLIDKETGCNAVVDPGAKSDKLIEQINADGAKLLIYFLNVFSNLANWFAILAISNSIFNIYGFILLAKLLSTYSKI